MVPTRPAGFSRFVVPAAIVASAVTASGAHAATKIWDGGAGTQNWTDAANWSPDGVPTAADDVIIDVVGSITVVVGSPVSALSVTCAEALILNSSITLGAASSVSGSVQWNSGAISGPGILTIEPGATLALTTGNTKSLIAATVRIGGTASWTDGAFALTQSANTGGTIEILEGGTFTLRPTSSFSLSGGGHSLVNNGTLVKPGGGDFTHNIPLVNNGTVESLAGGIILTGGGTNNGLFDATGGAASFQSNFTHTANAVLTGNCRFSAAIQTLTPGITVDSLVIEGATVTNAAPVVVDGTVAWIAGALSGGAPITFAGTSVLSTGNTKFLVAKTLKIGGSTSWTDGAFALTQSGNDGGTIEILEGGTFTLRPTSSFSLSGGGHSLVNNGTLVKPGEGVFTHNIPLNNLGTVEVQQGVLTTSGGYVQFANFTLTGGTIIVRNTATMQLSGSTVRTIGNGASVILDGPSSSFPAVALLGAIDAGGSLVLQGGRDFTAIPNDGSFDLAGGLSLASGSDFDVSGTLLQSATSTTSIAMADTAITPISATGAVTLDGALVITNQDGYEPAVPDAVTLLTGSAVSGIYADTTTRVGANILLKDPVLYLSNSVLFNVQWKPGAYIGAAGGSWFEPSNWGAGTLPTAEVDVYIPNLVVVDGLGAVAKDLLILGGGELRIGGDAPASLTAATIEVLAGGSLTIEDLGEVLTTIVTVRSGATLTLDGEGAALRVTNLLIEPGATFVWKRGALSIDGGSWTGSDPIAIGCEGEAELRLLAGAVVETGELVVCNAGRVRGNGTVDATSVLNLGRIEPEGDASPHGTLVLTGNFEQGEDGILLVSAAGAVVGVERDAITVGSQTILDGLLIVDLAGFVEPIGIDLSFLAASSIDGRFDRTRFLSAGSDFYAWSMSTATDAVLRTAPLPSAPGRSVEVVGVVPGLRTVAPSGNGAVVAGRAALIPGGTTRVQRIAASGAEPTLVGTPLVEPVAVFVGDGSFAGSAGVVLVGSGTSGFASLNAIALDDTTSLLVGPSAAFEPVRSIARGEAGLLLANGDLLSWDTPAGTPSVLVDRPANDAFGTTLDSFGRLYAGVLGGVSTYATSGASLVTDFVVGLGGTPPVAFGPEGSSWGDNLALVRASDGALLRANLGGSTMIIGTGFPTSIAHGAFGDDDALYLADPASGAIFRVGPPSGADGDLDGLPDLFDNCPTFANADQADCDLDGIGDLCRIASGNSDDINGNSIPDECDAVNFILGDFNGDGLVNPIDLAILLGQWGGDNPLVDVDDSGVVGASDLAIVLGAWTV